MFSEGFIILDRSSVSDERSADITFTMNAMFIFKLSLKVHGF